LDSPSLHHFDRFREGKKRNPSIPFFDTFWLALPTREVRGEEDLRALRAKSRRVKEDSKRLETLSAYSRFFIQFSLCCFSPRLAQVITRTSGYLEDPMFDSGPILLEENNVEGFVDGDDRNGTWMNHHFSIKDLISMANKSAFEVDDEALVDGFSTLDSETEHEVLAQWTASRSNSRGSRPAFRRIAPARRP